MFCTGLVNIMLRKLELEVPKNLHWDGGTQAYGIKFEQKMVPFSMSDVRRGDAVFRPYLDTSDQGHIAIALGGESDPVLQSFAWNVDATIPSVNVNYTLKESHSDGYYKFIIKGEDLWI